MQRTGQASLPLHGGKAPPWLFQRMTRLSRALVLHLVEEHGAEQVLARLADPYWFQAFGCVIGFDWHSSGVTTTTCGAIKAGMKGLERQVGLYVAGGKGGTSRKTPGEIELAGELRGFDPKPLVYASKTAAKVDSAAVQSGHQLYHHAFFFTEEGKWAVVQQGMREEDRTARRYHWLSEGLQSFVDEPHQAVVAEERSQVFNLVAHESVDARKAIHELATAGDGATLEQTLDLYGRLPEMKLPTPHAVSVVRDVDKKRLASILETTYANPPEDFEALLGVKGLGPKSLRALALTAEIIHGTPASFRDPARYSFAHGGKDGTPYVVDRASYDKTIEVMNRALQGSKIERSEKKAALERLSKLAA